VTRFHFVRRWTLTSVAVLAALLAGSCGTKLKLHPVRGQVFVAGKPAHGAIVVFHPLDTSSPDAPKPSGRVGADGSFTLSTFSPGDGAPAGEYGVAIAWLDDAPPHPVTGEVPAKLSPRYSQPSTSRLVVRVAEGVNEVPPFKLDK
jgi:hypothetical protein